MRYAPVVAMAALACSEPGPDQLLIHVTTDAPLPHATLPPEGPGYLFDTFRIQVVDETGALACDECQRDVALTHESLRDEGVSFGVVVDAQDKPLFVQAQMFLRAHLVDGEPDPKTTVQRVVALGATLPRGITSGTIFLPTDAVGVPIGTLSDPDVLVPQIPSPAIVGSWPHAKRVPCAGEARPYEVCIPGGAYWMGDRRMRADNISGDSSQPRLVVLSPFFLDREEVSVAALRETGPYGSTAVVPWSGSSTGAKMEDYCTFTTEPGPWDDRPANCLYSGPAEAHCERISKRLATEAEFEFAARGQDAAWLYPTGDSAPGCLDMVVNGSFLGGDSSAPCDWRFPQSPGSAPNDSTHGVLDIGGNVSEWVADKWNTETEPCWASPLLVDPVCLEASQEGSFRTVKGGNWTYAARAPAKLSIGRQYSDHWPLIGFRCARSDE